MPQSTTDAYQRSERSHWLRLQTLTSLRWAAILGQILAIVAADQIFHIQLPLFLCGIAVAAAVLANLAARMFFPANRRLSEREAFLSLLFDLCQLAFLVFVTGGLTNPFALLFLAPVMVSAAALQLRPTIALGLLAMTFVTVALAWHLPLRLASGEPIVLPPIFLFGYWVALIIGIGFLSFYARSVATEVHLMSDALLATQMALSREQKLTDLGGVVAAAAHELGTPLATIKLVSSELMDELADNPALLEDARLIREQADRCRDILRGMGKAGKSDELMLAAPVEAVIREAANPHLHRGKEVRFEFGVLDDAAPTPLDILRRPELIHGLRNLVQNAVDYAKATVWVETLWAQDWLRVTITDDGAGFSPQIIGRLGDPFLRDRSLPPSPDEEARPGYEGMGLGLFIAKTLLERTGAVLTFQNADDPFRNPEESGARRGAMVTVEWALADILGDQRAVLTENRVIA